MGADGLADLHPAQRRLVDLADHLAFLQRHAIGEGKGARRAFISARYGPILRQALGQVLQLGALAEPADLAPHLAALDDPFDLHPRLRRPVGGDAEIDR